MNTVTSLLARLEKAPFRIKFWSVVAIQFLILLALLFSQWMIGWTGKDVLLKTEPVDPRDFFYGDYVVLNYDINTLDTNLLADAPENEKGDELSIERHTPVYVILEKTGKYHEAAAVFLDRPDVADEQVMIRGSVLYVFDDEIRIRYGIERYYVQESKGAELEDDLEQIDVMVKVTNSGRSRVEGLVLGGNRLDY
ncbi:MAG: GDYXXLXY domain-containing protein [Bacillaceae bacterium]|nr:GDYXXLXY domain-containing protein [Bacillaceae bacterium]